MEKVTIKKVFRKEVETKYGIKPQIAIKTEQHGEKWLSSFKTKGTENWKEGDVVEIAIEKKGEFLNFTLTENPNTELIKRIERLENKIFGTETIQVEEKDEPTEDLW